MSRLFYPILFTVTGALATTLWMRHGLSTEWLSAMGAAVAQAQSPPSVAGNAAAGAGVNRGPAAGPGSRRPLPLPNGAMNNPPAAIQRLPPTVQPSRARQAPYTQFRLDSLGVPQRLEITRPVPIPSAKVVAKVGEEAILAADVLPAATEEFQQIAPQLAQLPEEQQAVYFDMMMAKYTKQLVQLKLVVREAKEHIPDDKFPDMKKTILSHFNSMALPGLLKHWKVTTETELDAKLKEHGTSLAKQKDAFVDQALVSEWMRKEVKFDEHVSHEELLKYYHEHLREYEFKAKVRYEEIRVTYGKKRRKEDAWRSIRELADRVYAGASMSELAKAHSEGLKADKGGLHDWTNQGSLSCAALDQALFSLPAGALSKIIDDEKMHAFVVVRVVERSNAGVTSFQEAQAGIRDKIRTERRQTAQTKVLSEFMEKNQFRAWTVYDDLLHKMEEKAKGQKVKAAAYRENRQ